MIYFQPDHILSASRIIKCERLRAFELNGPWTRNNLLLVLVTQCGKGEVRIPSLEVTCLSSEERLRASQYVLPTDELKFIIGKMLTRKVLGELLAVGPSQITFTTTQAGKPVLSPHASYHTLPRFNISKSHDLVLLGVHFSRSIGVDIEKHQAIPELLNIAERCWGREMRQALAALPRDDRAVTFIKRWCQMESEVKAFGVGMGDYLRINRNRIDWTQSGPIQMPEGYGGWVTVLLPEEINL